MDRIIYATAYVLLVMGFFTGLYSIAEDSTKQILDFSDSARNAIKCATQGISIYECSPELKPYGNYNNAYEYGFLSNLNKTKSILEKYNQTKDLNKQIKSLELQINELNKELSELKNNY